MVITADNRFFPVFLSGWPRRHWAKGKLIFLSLSEKQDVFNCHVCVLEAIFTTADLADNTFPLIVFCSPADLCVSEMNFRLNFPSFVLFCISPVSFLKFYSLVRSIDIYKKSIWRNCATLSLQFDLCLKQRVLQKVPFPPCPISHLLLRKICFFLLTSDENIMNISRGNNICTHICTN